MMTPGECNSVTLLWITCVSVYLATVLKRLWTEIKCIDAVVSSRDSPRDTLVTLKQVSLFSSEIPNIVPKHLTEFMAIFAVKEIPKIPLRTSRVVGMNGAFRVSRDAERQTIRFEVADPQKFSEWDVKVFTQVPVWVLADVFNLEGESEHILQKENRGWMQVIRGILFGPSKDLDHDDYRDMQSDQGLRNKSRESVGQRIQRSLFRFYTPLPIDSAIEIDAQVDDSQPTVPLIMIVQRRIEEQGIDDLAKISLFCCEEDIEVYADLNQSSISSWAPIPSFYGLEEKLCTICCDAPIDTLLVDCCHCATCENCTNSFRDGRCPICRRQFVEKIIIPIIPS
jgi:hypothetical protein